MTQRIALGLSSDVWQAIPGGQVTLLAGGYLAEEATLEVAPFAIALCPVTNEAYGRFIAAGGYGERRWWTPDGWALKEKGDWTEPRFWDNREWNRPLCPVVGVSWYEALAYCTWLGGIEGREVALPTEQQWQRAAQGDDGRSYPWGNAEPTEKLCNWNRAVDETTPVTRYASGASPYGVLDMSGNVWEWCLTGWSDGSTGLSGRGSRLLRGGSWSSDSPLSLRVTNRNSRDPNTRLDPADRNHVTVGFRPVCLQ